MERVPGYRAEGILGAGGFATVLAATRESDGGKVAIKIAHAGVEAAREQLLRERDALISIGAPAVPALHDQGVLPSGVPFLVLERIEAPTLAEKLQGWAGAAPPDELGPIAAGLLDALAAIHERGFCHLDLKPQNTFAGARVRLFDLGLSRRIGEPWPSSQAFAGTAAYMAPEQWRGPFALDARTDVYAAGAMLFELLTGRAPFVGSRGEVQVAHESLRPSRPSSIAPAAQPWDELVLRCLAKDPADRFADGRSLRAAIEAVPQRASQHPAAKAALVSPASPAQEKKPVALVYARTSANLAALQAAAESCGGLLAHVGAGRCALLFHAGAADRPVRRALRAAQALVHRKLATRALVDLTAVVFQPRKNGAPRVFSASFTKDASYPRETDPEGVLVTAHARELLAGPSLPAAREGIFVAPGGSREEAEATRVEDAVGPMFGRDALLADLAGSADAALAGRPGVAVVLSEPGMGKSHLCAALLQRLRLQSPDAELVELRAREPVAGDPDETFRSLLVRAFGLSAQPQRGEVEARIAAVLGPEGHAVWPALGLAVGVLDARDPLVKSLGAAPGVLRSMAMRAAGDALRRRASSRPVCILLDDAQWADDTTLDALEYAALAEASAPLWACVLARPSFGPSRPSFGERASRRDAHRLEPLDGDRAAEMCRALLAPADNVPAEAIERLVQRTHGVPLQLVELVRGLKREGMVRQRSSGTWYLATDEIDRLPDLPLIEWLAQRELSGLPPDLASHARLAALLGADFQAEELTAVLGLLEKRGAAGEFPLDGGVATARLRTMGLLVASRGGLLRYRHGLVRDAVAGSVPEVLRAHVHAAARDFYQTASWVPEQRRLPLLALHSARSGAREEAAALYLDLAERARDKHAYLDAERTYTASLDLLAAEATSQRLLALRGRGGMRYRTGRYEDALKDFSQARAAARKLEDTGAEVDLLLDEATALDWMNDFPGSVRLVEEARGLASSQAATPLFHARLALGRGRALFRAGRWSESCAALEEAVAVAETLSDDGYETLVIALLLLQSVLPDLGRQGEADRVTVRALELSGRRGDQLHFGSAIANRRNLLIARADAATAIADQRTFMRIGRELGNATLEYVAEFNLGELHYQEGGDLLAAESHARRSLEIEERHPEVAGRPAGALLLARILAYQGRGAEAGRMLSTIAARIAPAQQEGRTNGEFAPSEQILFEAVELAISGAEAPAWTALEERSARDSVEQEPIEIADLHGLAARRAGRAAEAESSFARALHLAERIPNLIGHRIRRREEGTACPATH